MSCKRIFVTVFGLVLLTVLGSGCGTPTPDPASIVWSEDFENWDHEGWES